MNSRFILFTLIVCTVILSFSFTSAIAPAVDVTVKVINDDFGTAAPEDFLIYYQGADRNLTQDLPEESFQWLDPDNAFGPGQNITVPVMENTTYNFTEIFFIPEGYTVSYSEGCSGNLTADENASCIITNNDPSHTPVGKWCYQEFADQATSCGGVAGGNYSESNNSNEWRDGSWSTDSRSEIGDYKVNYVKPTHALSDSMLKIRFFQAQDEVRFGFSDERYVAIPSGCFNKSTLNLRFTINETNKNALTYSCWDGNTWNTFGGRGTSEGIGFIEEAMIWDIGNQTSPPTNGTNSTGTNSTNTTSTNNTIVDHDHDGVIDTKDLCPNTVIPEGISLKYPRYANIDSDGAFETKNNKGKIVNSNYNMNITRGCSCTQILDLMKSKSQQAYSHGCTKATLDKFIKNTNENMCRSVK
ncbi:hypothetical protein KW787_03795 [Candidatus Pacearchaeota archaeon]|nr:hypothetical protein [Candidatus Pacearchaeota archaeon]